MLVQTAFGNEQSLEQSEDLLEASIERQSSGTLLELYVTFEHLNRCRLHKRNIPNKSDAERRSSLEIVLHERSCTFMLCCRDPRDDPEPGRFGMPEPAHWQSLALPLCRHH